MTEHDAWIKAIRESHDRLAALVQPLDERAVQGPSYDSGWSIAQVASHLGSQAEIFGMFLDAGLSEQNPPGGEQFGPIWDRWNARPPAEQVADSITANERFVTRLEQLSGPERDSFALSMFGSDVDLSGFAAMRLSEHAVHTWDIAVALDPKAVIAAHAVELLIDALADTAARAGKSTEPARTIVVETVAPRRGFVLTTGPDVRLDSGPAAGPAELHLSAEAFIRLVYGRLDPAHTPEELTGAELLGLLREVFPGV